MTCVPSWKAGTFWPLPVRERKIPSREGREAEETRHSRRDKVVQAALKLVLEPIFEADFEPVSYGFRPVRRAHDAIAEIHQFGGKYLSQGHALGRDPPRPSTRSVPLATYA